MPGQAGGAKCTANVAIQRIPDNATGQSTRRDSVFFFHEFQRMVQFG
jgi:hypothetical protein